MAIKPKVLRTIAETQLNNLFPHQVPSVHEEIVTSVVRQWITYNGNAGVFTIPVHYWLTVVHLEGKGKVEAGIETVMGSLWKNLGTWGVLEEDLPRVVHDLSVAQAAVFRNAEGLTVRVRTNPLDHTFRYEEVKEDDGLED
jgi:hypothetical protein